MGSEVTLNLSAGVWIAGAGLLFAMFTTAGGMIWAVAGIRQTLQTQIDTMRTEWTRALAAAVDEVLRRAGEGDTAMREKMNQLELFVRDTYVPWPHYNRDQEQKWETIKAMQGSLEARIEALHGKIDRLVEVRNKIADH